MEASAPPATSPSFVTQRSRSEDDFEGATIAVHDAISGEPILGADVHEHIPGERLLGARIASAEEQGLVRIAREELRADREFAVHARNYEAALIGELEPRSSTEVALTPSAVLEAIFTDRANCPLEGVRLAVSRRPLPFSAIAQWKPEISAKGLGDFGLYCAISDAEGVAHVEGLSTGSYYLACFHPGYLAVGLDFDQTYSVKPGVNLLPIEVRPIYAAVGRVVARPEKEIYYCTWDVLRKRVGDDHTPSAEYALPVHRQILRNRFPEAMVLDLCVPKDVDALIRPLEVRVSAVFADFSTTEAGTLTARRLNEIDRCETLTVEPPAGQEVAYITITFRSGDRLLNEKVEALARLPSGLPTSIELSAGRRTAVPPGSLRITSLSRSMRALVEDFDLKLAPHQEISKEIDLPPALRKVRFVLRPPSASHPLLGSIKLTGPARSLTIPTRLTEHELLLEEGEWHALLEFDHYAPSSVRFAVLPSDEQLFEHHLLLP